jgi:hypothetical protein
MDTGRDRSADAKLATKSRPVYDYVYAISTRLSA